MKWETTNLFLWFHIKVLNIHDTLKCSATLSDLRNEFDEGTRPMIIETFCDEYDLQNFSRHDLEVIMWNWIGIGLGLGIWIYSSHNLIKNLSKAQYQPKKKLNRDLTWPKFTHFIPSCLQYFLMCKLISQTGKIDYS